MEHFAGREQNYKWYIHYYETACMKRGLCDMYIIPNTVFYMLGCPTNELA
jgi:hypothetical protein